MPRCLLALHLLLAVPTATGIRPWRAPTPRAEVILGSPRLKVAFLKQQLEANGVSTTGIVEKEELMRLYEGLGVVAPSAAVQAHPFCLPFVEIMGGAYAEINGVRLLVDSGAATSILSHNAAQRVSPMSVSPGADMVLTGESGLRIFVRAAAPGQFFPGMCASIVALMDLLGCTLPTLADPEYHDRIPRSQTVSTASSASTHCANLLRWSSTLVGVSSDCTLSDGRLAMGMCQCP